MVWRPPISSQGSSLERTASVALSHPPNDCVKRIGIVSRETARKLIHRSSSFTWNKQQHDRG